MPLYEYECDSCGERFEVIQKFSDAPLETCKKCGKGPVHKLMSSPAIQFKGSGWYVTDYARKDHGSSPSKTESGGKDKAKPKDGEKKAEAPAAESSSSAATPAPAAAKKE